MIVSSSLTLPTFSLFGTPEPLAKFADLFNKIEHGGLFKIKVKVLSSNTVRTTGITNPCLSFVASLNFLQKSMILTPCCPKAGPTGGAGFAAPAGICNLIFALIGFAMITFSPLASIQVQPVSTFRILTPLP